MELGKTFTTTERYLSNRDHGEFRHVEVCRKSVEQSLYSWWVGTSFLPSAQGCWGRPAAVSRN